MEFGQHSRDVPSLWLDQNALDLFPWSPRLRGFIKRELGRLDFPGMTVADRIIPGHHDISFESGQICHTSFSALSGRLDEDGGLGHLCAPTRIEHYVSALVEGQVRRFQRVDFRSQNTPHN